MKSVRLLRRRNTLIEHTTVRAVCSDHLRKKHSLTLPWSRAGHRRRSWIEEDLDELIELRARQRTFGGGIYLLLAFPSDPELTFSRRARQALTSEQLSVRPRLVLERLEAPLDARFVGPGNLGYALIVLKIFDPDFAKSWSLLSSFLRFNAHCRCVSMLTSLCLASETVGLLYVILSILLLLIAQYRRRRSDHDFAGVSSLLPAPSSFSPVVEPDRLMVSMA